MILYLVGIKHKVPQDTLFLHVEISSLNLWISQRDKPYQYSQKLQILQDKILHIGLIGLIMATVFV